MGELRLPHLAMPAVIIKDNPDRTDGNPVPAGDEYISRCPQDGCGTVERSFKNGGRTAKGEEHLKWSMFNASPAKGLCGASWTVDTTTGVKDGHKKGRDAKWKSKAAAAERYTSTPSQQYRDNYERVFGHD